MRQMVLATVLVFVSSSWMTAQDRHVRVMSIGTVNVKPDVASISANIVGSGETIDQAIDDYSRIAAEVSESFDPMEFRDVQIKIGQPILARASNGGFVMPVPALPGGPPPAMPDNTISFSQHSTVEFRIEKTNKMKDTDLQALIAKIMEGIESSELEMNFLSYSSTASLVKRSISDWDASYEKAIENALASARKKAEAIARLSGKQLGSVISVEETGTNHHQQPAVVNAPYVVPSNSFTSISASDHHEIPVIARLQVTYELLD